MVSLSADHRHRQAPGRSCLDRQARHAPEAEIFGKRILFTDCNDWPAAEVIAAYRSQADAEAGCRQRRGRHLASFSLCSTGPSKDRRARVLLRAHAGHRHLMRCQAAQAGMDFSVRELLYVLAAIQEIVLLHPSAGGRPRARRMLTGRDPPGSACSSDAASAPTPRA
jgi:hypothetical protein